ncbi:MAG TPA: adenosylhomocysteinase [Mycobacteriales bacterium]|nr:adenosylhomocysteinase [Mycobacteriales bacterium]
MKPFDVADPGLAEAGIARIDWADRAMPVLRQIRDRFTADKPLAGLRVGACMHVTAETANLMRTLVAGGAEVALAASNPLSTQDDTAAALVAEFGVAVYARARVSLPEYYGHIGSVLDRAPDLVLDDACDLVSTLHAERTDLLEKVRGGCEQTTTGLLRLRAMSRAGALRIPMVAVNDTGTKQLFDNTYGTGQSAMDAIFRATNMLLAGRTVVVAGFGSCGRGVASRAQGLGSSVIVTEIDPLKALDAAMSGYTVMPMSQAARVGDVFITVTGNRDVITGEHFRTMKDGAILCNAGHFDVEIDVRWLADNAKSVHRQVRPSADEYVLDDGRRLVLLAEGRVANLAAAEGHPPAVMDMSFADQALTTAWLAGHADTLGVGVHDVPVEVDNEVATLKLASMDIAIDALTPVQEKYLDSWEQGS